MAEIKADFDDMKILRESYKKFLAHRTKYTIELGPVHTDCVCDSVDAVCLTPTQAQHSIFQ